MSSHGLVPPALFLCVGVLYDRHKTRLARYYGGLVSTMPNLPTISLSSTLANMSSPGTSSFIGEFSISVGAFQRNSLVATLAALGMILGAAYSLFLYNRVVSGNCKPDFLHKFSDPNGREVSFFLPFLVGGATVRWTTKMNRVNKCDHYIVGACDGTDATSLISNGWHSPLQKSTFFSLPQKVSEVYFFLLTTEEPGWDRDKGKKAQGATMHGTFSTLSPRHSWMSDSLMQQVWTSQ